MLEVLNGGRVYSRPCALAVDLDAYTGPAVPESGVVRARALLLEPEARALLAARETGLGLVVVTSAEEGRVRRMLDARGLHAATVISDAAARAASSERSRTRLELLADLACRHGRSLREVAVIATHPEDCPMMLEAGVGFALRDAGGDAAHAADRVFPPRRSGGLAAAIDAVVALTPRNPSGRG